MNDLYNWRVDVMTDDITELVTALAKAQAELKNPSKNCVNPHFKNRYADLASIIETIKGPLTKYGISFVQVVHQDEGKSFLRTILMFKNQKIWSDVPLVAEGRNLMQAMGSAMTYAKRYGLQSIVGIAADEDEDGHMATQHPPKRNQPKPMGYKKKLQYFIKGKTSDLKDVETGKKLMNYLNEELENKTQGECHLPGFSSIEQLPEELCKHLVEYLEKQFEP